MSKQSPELILGIPHRRKDRIWGQVPYLKSMVHLLAILATILLWACDEDKPRDNFYTDQDPQIYISQPEGRMVMREALKNLENWSNRPHFTYTPFTELIFDAHRNEVEMLDEDNRKGSFELVRLGNGHYRLDNLYELRYNSRNVCWQLFTIGEANPPLTLDGYTMPDTVKISNISAFKYMVHRNLIAGVYHVTDKDGKQILTSTVAFAPDGQLMGVKGFLRYNVVVNGPDANAELMPIELYNSANKLGFFGCFERQDSTLTIYEMHKTKSKNALYQYEKGKQFAKLIKVDGPPIL